MSRSLSEDWKKLFLTRSTLILFGVADTYAGQRFGSSACLCFLSYSMVVRHEHKTVTKGKELWAWVISAFTGSWVITGITLFQGSNYSMIMNRGIPPAQSGNANSGYVGMCHASQKLLLLTEMSLRRTTLSGGGQGNAHKSHC